MLCYSSLSIREQMNKILSYEIPPATYANWRRYAGISKNDRWVSSEDLQKLLAVLLVRQSERLDEITRNCAVTETDIASVIKETRFMSFFDRFIVPLECRDYQYLAHSKTLKENKVTGKNLLEIARCKQAHAKKHIPYFSLDYSYDLGELRSNCAALFLPETKKANYANLDDWLKAKTSDLSNF